MARVQGGKHTRIVSNRRKGSVRNGKVLTIELSLKADDRGERGSAQRQIILELHALVRRYLVGPGHKSSEVRDITDGEDTVSPLQCLSERGIAGGVIKLSIQSHVGRDCHVQDCGLGARLVSVPAYKLLSGLIRKGDICQDRVLRQHEGIRTVAIVIGHRILLQTCRVQHQVDIPRIMVSTQDGLRAGRSIGLADHTPSGNGNGAVTQLVGQGAHRHTGKAAPAPRPGHAIVAGQVDRGGLDISTGPGSNADS